MTHMRSALLTLTLASLISACSTTPPPPPPLAVSEITGKVCTDKADLSKAIAMTPKRKAQWHNIATNLDAQSPCLNLDGKPSNYVVYALPSAPSNHTLTIGGAYEAMRILGPLVTVLNADGQPIRTFTAERFANVGSTLGVQFRPSEEARFVLVQTNPQSAGVEVKAFETQLITQTNYAYNPYNYGGTYTTQYGREGATVRKFSHEGVVSVTIQAVAGKIGLPNEK
ncbi:MAG: hypothetical protein CFE32_14240 [Alphaproteobacteria bacterium PA3]|nr:MAG: hypothetical protein CFE32_14240 [Alphaproteobacteria bacterium PA3]